MIRTILFLVLIGAAALGAAFVADQEGSAVLVVGGWRVETSFAVFVLSLLALVAAAMLLWVIVREIWRIPRRLNAARVTRRHVRARQSVTQGLIAIGAGDQRAAHRYALLARRHAPDDPLALLLQAQEAQLAGDRNGAQRAFEAMASREDTRLLGLRGLFIEAQRSDDPVRAVAIAEATLKDQPSSNWASQAVLGFRCAQGDWAGALAILDSNHKATLVDTQTWHRQRAVLLTAQALELEQNDRDRSRDLASEAVKLAPTLVPAVVLAAKFLSEQHQVRKAMRMIETAWRANPHPDLADAYAHVRLADSALERLARMESLAQMTPDGEEAALESAVALARVAIDAREYARARSALAPFVTSPTQRVAMLMAEIERDDNGDAGRTREWTFRAVRARHDPVWTADGYVSDRWRPVSPVTGKIDVFRWTTPVAALPSDHPSEDFSPAFDAQPVTDVPAIAAQSQTVTNAAPDQAAAVSSEMPAPGSAETGKILEMPQPPPLSRAAPAQPSSAEPPLFRPRRALAAGAGAVPEVIPLVRAPDDPGVDDEEMDDGAYDSGDGTAQAGGFKGFLSRMRR